jgi:hypothetical protein
LVGLISLRGRFNYTNLSRYSKLDEKTYRRRFEGKIDFTEFNQLGIREVTANATTLIGVMDCSFTCDELVESSRKAAIRLMDWVSFLTLNKAKQIKAWKYRP